MAITTLSMSWQHSCNWKTVSVTTSTRRRNSSSLDNRSLHTRLRPVTSAALAPVEDPPLLLPPLEPLGPVVRHDVSIASVSFRRSAYQLHTQLLLHPSNGLFSRTTWVSRYQIGKTSLDLNEARDGGVLEWQWHQLDHVQTICTSLQTDKHTNTTSVKF